MRSAQVLIALALLGLALADYWFGNGHKQVKAALGGPAKAGPNTAAAFIASAALADSTATSTGSTGAVPASFLRNVSGIVGDAKRYLGIPYLWGGTTTAGFDCSGLSERVYADVGIAIPRTSQQQSAAGRVISQAQALPGDLVFFGGGPGAATHVGIYEGNGIMLDAAHTGTVVREEPLFAGGYFERMPGAPSA